MASVSRNPLASRVVPPQSPSGHHGMKTTRTAAGLSKRPRSPDPVLDSRTKRAKGVPPSPAPSHVQAQGPPRDDLRVPDKDDKRAQREAQREEFRVKYRKAFPSWVFHFDADLMGNVTADGLQMDIEYLEARVDDFFSNAVTHLITNVPVPTDFANKENLTKARASRAASLLKSPIKLKGRAPEGQPGYDIVMKKALEFGIKIWNVAKLESVLDRCLTPAERPSSQTVSHTSTAPNGQHALSRLLASERLHGTSERDPSQKRHDYRYFSKQSYFVLVEDINQDLATIAALEYPISKSRDGRERGGWPVLHCHPHARGPFTEFDEREKRRWEKQEQADKERQDERERAKTRFRMKDQERRAQAQQEEKRHRDLRRTMSMNNLRRNATFPDPALQGMVDLDADATFDSAQASGYLASNTYIAASGNSVSVTSTAGTTSTAGQSLRNMQLPATLREKLQQQVVTARRFPAGAGDGMSGVMGPPSAIPERRNGLLRKSRSTNTLKLPKRDEGTKPGYCESCRLKFDSFSSHIKSRRHRKFAMDDANFVQLDSVLSRVRRRSLAEVEAERRAMESRRQSVQLDDSDDDDELRQYVGRSVAPDEEDDELAMGMNEDD